MARLRHYSKRLERAVMTYGALQNLLAWQRSSSRILMKPLQRKVAYKQIDKHPIANRARSVRGSKGSLQTSATKRSDATEVNGAMEYLQGITEVPGSGKQSGQMDIALVASQSCKTTERPDVERSRSFCMIVQSSNAREPRYL